MEELMADYSAVLADLRAKRAKIDVAIEAIEDLMGTSEPTIKGAASVPSRGQEFTNSTVYEAALAVLKRTGKPMLTADIAKAILRGGYKSDADNFYNTVYGTLGRSASKGEIVKSGAKWVIAANRASEREQHPVQFPSGGQMSTLPLVSDRP